MVLLHQAASLPFVKRPNDNGDLGLHTRGRALGEDDTIGYASPALHIPLSCTLWDNGCQGCVVADGHWVGTVQRIACANPDRNCGTVGTPFCRMYSDGRTCADAEGNCQFPDGTSDHEFETHPLLGDHRPPSSVSGPCTAVLAEAKAKHAAGIFFSPAYLIDVKCDERGDYMPVQSWLSTGYSWCVNTLTNEKFPHTEVAGRHGVLPLNPEACLALQHPPKGNIELFGRCQMADISDSEMFKSSTPFDPQNWFSHCRTEPHGYCPTCVEGMSCKATKNTNSGFRFGICDREVSAVETLSSCVDDPNHLLAGNALDCTMLQSGGWCVSDNMNAVLPTVFKHIGVSAVDVCPLSCGDGCVEARSAGDVPSAGSNTIKHLLADGVIFADQVAGVVESGQNFAHNTCYGCWVEADHSCKARANSMGDSIIARTKANCEKSGNEWRDQSLTRADFTGPDSSLELPREPALLR